MRVAFGAKAHSGWAAFVVAGERDGEWVIIDRERMPLVEETWAKAPYHAAEHLKPDAARDLVSRGIAEANRIARRQMREALERERRRGHEAVACAVLAGAPMPGWTTDEILAVHFRMHKAEGVLFRDVLVHAAEACKIKVVSIPEKQLMSHGEKVLGRPGSVLVDKITLLGKAIGPPWGKDQKDAALAALVALES